jgi:hypothetical protein
MQLNSKPDTYEVPDPEFAQFALPVDILLKLPH